ncbi:ATPase synthesis protein 25 mitochondrial [Sporothrix bragantina]|uniref:ATPase synthesis protein 25 n=1 Tax=Sporothrix bragantina TaxID=671064 RepID=A0ABP0B0S2_9PEZI
MLQPTARAAGSAAYRVPLQRALQSAPARPRCQIVLDASAASSRASRTCGGSSMGPATLIQPRLFSVSHQRHSRDDDATPATSAAPQESTDTASSTSTTSPSSSTTPSSTATSTSTSTSSDIPWYMKVDVPKHATLTLQDTPLPEIPPNVPSLVKPLLTFVAEDLGLDDLKLLDLRALDPPAALGPDLIMLFGSARSERHLHVSADRLVRWLRKYGINATADGLLGRNELKIKLRRKARRAKLLGNMASLENAAGGPPIDDGISTQWVCLHAGTLGRSRVEGGSTDAEGRTTGFGSLRSTGSTVVVQMFTEAKRKQLDLETLWGKTLARSVKKRTDAGEDVPEWAVQAAKAAREAATAKAAGKEADFDELAEDGEEKEDPFAIRPKTTTSSTSNIASVGGQQRRGYATAASTRMPPADDIIESLTGDFLAAGDVQNLWVTLRQNSVAKAEVRKQLAEYLDRIPPESVFKLLEAIRRDNPTPSFVLASRAAMRSTSPAETWDLRARIYATAVTVGHWDYPFAGLAELIREMQRGGYPVDRSMFELLLLAIMRVRVDTQALWSPTDSPFALKTQTALSLIDTMMARGEDTVTRGVLVAMISGLALHNRTASATSIADAAFQDKVAEMRRESAQNGSSPATVATPVLKTTLRNPSRTDHAQGVNIAQILQEAGDGTQGIVGYETDLNTAYPSFEPVTEVALDETGAPLDKPTSFTPDQLAADALQTRLEDLLRQTGLPCLEDEQLMQLLSVYGRAADWPRFWALWRMPTQHGLSRSPALYQFLFEYIVRTKSRALCADALRRCFSEMFSEKVAVIPSGPLYKAVMNCIRVADNKAELTARNLPAVIEENNAAMMRQANREFVVMYRFMESLQ